MKRIFIIMTINTLLMLYLLSGSETARLADGILILYGYYLAISVLIGVYKIVNDSRMEQK